jgi:2-polyprenyl-3-methyl-5-hydroxy-6-metoxy-1,4-benzoquinol methylase
LTLQESGSLLELQNTLYTSKNPTRRWLHCSRRDWILDAIARHCDSESECALEIGPGSGIYLPAVAELFSRVVASDIEPEFLSQASLYSGKYPNISVSRDDITNSQFLNQSFDLVLCTEVIEHIANSVAALTEMHRILRIGGRLILSTPQKYSTLEMACKVAFLPGIIQIVRRVYQEPILETGHINLLTEREVERQLRHAGFDIIEHHVGGLYLPVIAELFGDRGRDLAIRCEGMMKRVGATGMLWTQFYVAVRSSAA